MQISTSQIDTSRAVLDSYSVRAIVKSKKLYLTLARVVRELNKIADARDQDMNMLLRAYGKQTDKGDLRIPDDKLSEHGKKMYEYLDEPRDIHLPGKIRLEAFEEADIHPTAQELAVLDWLISFDETDFLFMSSDGAV
jgi:hypothetical protein